MQNLEQIRAAKALKVAAKTSKMAFSKLPAMILANGLLATVAFASETKKNGTIPKRPEMAAAFSGTAEHLATPVLGFNVLANCKTGSDLIEKLSRADSMELQRATSEVLAFLAYVKRFAIKDGHEEKDAE